MKFNLNITGNVTVTVSWEDAYLNTFSEELDTTKDYTLPVNFTLETAGEFVGTPTINWQDDYMNSESLDFTVNGTTATLDDFNPGYSSTTETATIYAEAGEIGYTYNFNFNDTENLSVNTPLDISFTKGDNPEIILTADEGYFFQERPGAYFQDPWLNSIEVLFTTDQTDDFKTVYKLTDIESTLNVDFTDETFTINVDSPVLEIPSNEFGGFGILNIYQVNSDILKDLALLNPVEYPLNEYVLSLTRLFINVDEIETNEIKLGDWTTGINADLIKTDMLELDLGTVTIPEKYNNSNDYNNAEIEIFLPFNGFEKLETENVINKTIKLVYKVNILNGDTAILIYSDDVLINEFDANVGYEMPFYITSALGGKLEGNLKVKNKHLLGFTPYILHKNYEPINSVYTKEFAIKNFNEINGFYKMTDVNLNQSGLLKSEYDEIIKLLNEGVIF